MSYSNPHLKRYENASLDVFKTPTPEHERLLKVMRHCLKNGFSKNIIVSGGLGTGKTYLAHAIIHELATFEPERKLQANITLPSAWISETILYVNVKEIIDYIKNCFSCQVCADLSIYKQAPLLIIDEVGVQYGTDFERIELFPIFNARYNNDLTTIVLTNLDKIQLDDVLGRRICDRLFGGGIYFELDCPSMRGAE